MNVTDEEMAKTLDKTKLEIQKLKDRDITLYKLLKVGVLCRKLDLDVEDLHKIYEKKVFS